MRIAPVFRSRLCTTAERKAVQWYLNTIPHSTTLSEVRETLAQLMQKQYLTEAEAHDCETTLLRLETPKIKT